MREQRLGIDLPGEQMSRTRTGYGRELIERALPYALNAEIHLELTEDGVCCTISLPLMKRSEGADYRGDRLGGTNGSGGLSQM
jgi:hypothetical protein